MKAIVFDTETTGLPKKKSARLSDNDVWPYVVQFSWLICDLETSEVEFKDFIITLPPNMKIPSRSTEIHGITDEIMREKGVPCKQVLEEFIKDANECTYYVAHNFSFDKTILRVELYRHQLPDILKKNKYIEFCTMKYGAPVCNIIRYCPFRRRLETKPPKLIELYKELFNEIPKNLHNSLIDVFVCFRCFYKLLTSKDIFEENVSLSEEFYSLT